MEKALVYFLFLQIIKISIQIVPFWNFTSSAIDLLDNKDKKHIYTKYSVVLHDVPIKLERTISKENEKIKIVNKLIINDIDYGETEFDDIESHYQDGKGNYLICPKGKYHMYLYYKEEKNFKKLIPDGFPNINNWNLMCFYQYRQKTLFIAYLNSQVNFYQFNFQEETFRTNKNIHEGIHAFKWKTSQYGDDPSKMQMFAIINNGNNYFLDNIIFEIKEGEEFNYQEIGSNYLTTLKSNYLANFKNDNYQFFWINYNNISDFEIGFHNNDKNGITTDNFYSLNITKFSKNPLAFFEKVNIEDIKFIYGMNFAYYKLKNEKGKYYYGIIDASQNKVIFNTDEEILEFITYSDSAMLAITKNSAYKICAYRDEKDCVNCSNNDFKLDSSNYNFCGNKCPKFKIMPDDICSNTCDESIFINQNNNECGLCKDLNKENTFKFINHPECLKEKPENSIYINEELKILDCDINYQYENKICIPKCREQYFLQDGKCVEKCLDNYFINDKKCQKCDNSCEACNKISNNCTKCSKGKYLDITSEIQLCKNCSDKCEVCKSSENNCITCKKNSSFKYLFKNSCVENCPNNTKLNKKKEKCEVIKNSKTDKIMLMIFTIITGILLFIVLFNFFIRNCCQNKKTKESLLNAINTKFSKN